MWCVCFSGGGEGNGVFISVVRESYNIHFSGWREQWCVVSVVDYI